MTSRRALRARVVGSDTKGVLGADGEGSAVGGGFIACRGGLAEAEVREQKSKKVSVCESAFVSCSI